MQSNFSINDGGGFMDDRIQYLKELLVDEQVSYFGRISNMLCVGFGEALKLKNYNGNTVTKSSIALHIQAAWRIISNSKVLIASSDFYTPNSRLNSSEDFEYSEFEWDIQGNNLFDEKAIQWLNNKLYVKNFYVSKIGDLKISFSNDDILEVFSDASDDTELWRIFKPGSKQEHIVMNGTGLR